jgi:tetratricopeptide (TPR) repeat protein
MANESTAAPTANPTLQTTQVYGMAIVCLVMGLAIGYLFRASQSPISRTLAPRSSGPAASVGSAMGGGQHPSAGEITQRTSSPAQPAVNAASNAAHGGGMARAQMPSLAEMKQMADKQAAPLLEKLKSDPNNSALLIQVGAIYHTTHQFKQAAAYYDKAVRVDPKSVAIRTKLASSLYRDGDVDGAIAQLNRALSYDPKDANALFDLGMIKLQGKQDGKGALAAWKELLKSNPELSTDRRATVEKLMADVMTTLADQHGTAQQGTRGAAQ